MKRLRQALSSHMLDVRLFGSEARGEATSESDIDVLVVVQPDTDRVSFEDRIIDIAVGPASTRPAPSIQSDPLRTVAPPL